MCLVLKWFYIVNLNDKTNAAYTFSELLSIHLMLGGMYCGLKLGYNHDDSLPHRTC